MRRYFERIYILDADGLGADMLTVRGDKVFIVGSGFYDERETVSRKEAARRLRNARKYHKAIKLGAR